jgi:hypothetical protein
MPTAKDLQVRSIDASDARAFVRANHYSGKVDTRSQVHLGVFWQERLEGVLQFGPSIDKNKSIGIVADTPWNGFMELNRLAFTDRLPRNSESRAISVAMRLIRKHAPHIQWVLSYADGTQCGDGAIYRASGFHLIGIKKNSSMWRMPDGEVIAKIVLEPGFSPGSTNKNSVKARYGKTGTESSTAFLRRIGAEQLPGFQLRYIYFLDPTARDRLTVPILPFSDIDKHGAGMYRGTRRGSVDSDTPDIRSGEGGASPTSRLQIDQATG